MLDIHLDRTGALVLAGAFVIAGFLFAVGAWRVGDAIREGVGLLRVLVSLLAAIRERGREDSEPPPPLRRH